MKEVIAIIRRHRLQETKAGLLGIGIPALTMVSVEGRGKQKGLPGWNYELDPTCKQAEVYRSLAKNIIDNKNFVIPKPMAMQELENMMVEFGIVER